MNRCPEKIEHNSQQDVYRYPFGAVEVGENVHLGVFVLLGEVVEEAVCRFWQEGIGERILPLEKSSDGYYRTVIKTEKKGLIWYYFRLKTKTRTFYYGNNDEKLGGVGTVRENEPPSFQITVFEKGTVTPDWLKESIIYQIFPDRFSRSEDVVFPKRSGALLHTFWEDTPYYFKDNVSREMLAYDFFGGNLRGIMEKLDYLSSLGISLIYLNPIFKAESNHRYDTGDYEKIDEALGTEEDLALLVEKAGEKGIRIILDGVFSHTGSNSRYFNVRGEYSGEGAVQSTASPYYSWYKFTSYPKEYKSWWGVKTLPEVNECEPSYLDYVINGKESVLKKWQSYGIGGWRLDVIDELPTEFLCAFYKKLKEDNPENILIGEVWEDASNKESYGKVRNYLCGGKIDSAMNYPFRRIVLDFLLGYISAKDAGRRVESLRENYPKENFYAMMNLLGSHDVERLATILGEGIISENLPDLVKGASRLSDEKRDISEKRQKMAAMWQFVFPGVPSIYYGDEIGMEGQKDPFNRATFPWGKEKESKLLCYYRKLGSLRKNTQALKTGEYISLLAEENVIAFARQICSSDVFGRYAKDDTFIMVLNRGKSPVEAVIDTALLRGEVFEEVLRSDDEELGVVRVSNSKLSLTIPALTSILYRVCSKGERERLQGVLLPIASLPSSYGIGDMGEEAYAFIDYLKEAGQKVWQILPLNPVDSYGSPYHSSSAFAGNPLFIDLVQLKDWGLLSDDELKKARVEVGKVDYEECSKLKEHLLRLAFSRIKAEKKAALKCYEANESYWLHDYALFQAAKKEYGGKRWQDWDEALQRRDKAALSNLLKRQEEEYNYAIFEQYIFSYEWKKLRRYANENGVMVFGDIPIFLSVDSADVWAHQEYFKLENGEPISVAGVPPDYFSENGQLWGNPLYDWEKMRKDDFKWWTMRLKHLFEFLDIVRIDHFRGFEAYWEIPRGEKTAINGKWTKSIGEEFFVRLKQKLGKLPLVAEDLGVITPEVVELRRNVGFPGMKILEFELFMGKIGFSIEEDVVAYSGTHDNNTLLGWYRGDISDDDRKKLALFTGEKEEKKILERLIEILYASNAYLVILPIQDILFLDGTNRLNMPGTIVDNWTWRLDSRLYTDSIEYLRRISKR